MLLTLLSWKVDSIGVFMIGRASNGEFTASSGVNEMQGLCKLGKMFGTAQVGLEKVPNSLSSPLLQSTSSDRTKFACCLTI